MPTATSLIDPNRIVIGTSMTSSSASRGVNKTGMVLRIPGPTSDPEDYDSPRRGAPRAVGGVGTAADPSPPPAGQSALPDSGGSLRLLQRQRKVGRHCHNNNNDSGDGDGGETALPHGGDAVSCLPVDVPENVENPSNNDPDIGGEELDASAAGRGSIAAAGGAAQLLPKIGSVPCSSSEPLAIVPALKRKDSASKGRSRGDDGSGGGGGGSNRTVCVSEPSVETIRPGRPRTDSDEAPDTKTFTLPSVRAASPNHARRIGPRPAPADTTTSTTTTTTTTTQVSAAAAAAVSKRRISFPADSVLTAVIQDGDTPELVRILTGRHGPGLVQRAPSPEGGGRRGVDVRQTNHVGLTALHHAVLANNLDAAKLLLCYGADVNAQDVHGFSPLHTAAACGFLPLTTLLLLFGADVFALTMDSELPVDVAKDLGVVRVLTAEMTRLVHRELWVASLVRARAGEAWLLLRKLLACVLLFVLHVFVSVRTRWRRHRKSE